jgi:hypothetical protein
MKIIKKTNKFRLEKSSFGDWWIVWMILPDNTMVYWDEIPF